MNTKGKAFKVFASGIRQPWQMVFPAGSSAPFVSDLGQDSGVKNAPDFLLRVHQGDNFGFPSCAWVKKSVCKGFTKPAKFFSPHTDVMGLAIIGKTLYMSEFGGNAPGKVVSMPLSGGKVTPVVTGFVAPVVGLGANGHWLYIGELTGRCSASSSRSGRCGLASPESATRARGRSLLRGGRRPPRATTCQAPCPCT